MKMTVLGHPRDESILVPWLTVPPIPTLPHLSPSPATLCLSRWLEAKTSRPDATCASPAKFKGQHIRDTDAFRGCKFPTKRSKKAGRH